MRGLHQILTLNIKKRVFMIGLVVGIASLAGGTGLLAHQASAATCDDNDIIKCGFSQNDKSDFVNKVKQNSVANGGHNDLQAFYSYSRFGFTSADYDDFVQHAVLANAMRDGSIKLPNGQVVLKNGITFGRSLSVHSPNPTTITVGGTKYYGNVPDITYKAGVNSIPIYVLFDKTGTMRFAVMPACGNPMTGNVVPTSASCTALHATPVPGQPNTYDFTTDESHQGNATIKNFVYNFGDGQTKTVTDGKVAVRHTYKTMGDFHASVTVYASVPGNDNLQLTSTLCTKVISIRMPSCVQLMPAVVDKSKWSYSFTVTASPGSGVTLTGADFDFGDGKTQTGVKPNTATTVTVAHVYSAAGSYNISSVLHFSFNGADLTALTCTGLVTPETVAPECKPGVPVGNPECNPCQYDTSLPSDSPKCKPPELPNTGAGNTIAIFTAVAIGGWLVYRQLLFRKHRAAYTAAQMGTSPLPLGDPLSPNAPLDGTPLAPHRRTGFRRRRQF
jgi:hypothetical protein